MTVNDFLQWLAIFLLAISGLALFVHTRLMDEARRDILRRISGDG